jgi:hypothetical protein
VWNKLTRPLVQEVLRGYFYFLSKFSTRMGSEVLRRARRYALIASVVDGGR